MTTFIGVDEVGRGCWAGPVVAGAVVLGKAMPGLKDSKVLTKTQREKFAAEIELQARAIGLGWVMPRELDAIGLTEAVRVAMRRAVAEIKIAFEEIIIDGKYNFLADEPRAKAVVRADATIAAVSAASIVAKVARDRWMTKAALRFPVYHFEKHVGYGTKLHLEMLKVHGTCALHRLSYKPIQTITKHHTAFTL